MSKVKIQGDAGGTGTFTISAPNSDTDRSLTLPDTAGEFVTADASGNVSIGTTNASLFDGVGSTAKLVVKGSDTATSIANNSKASIVIANDDGTADNLAGLHFARADTDDDPHYAGASIVAQFKETQVTSQYPKADIAFLTSTQANYAPSEKMRLAASGNVGIGTSSPSSKLEVVYSDSGANGLVLKNTGVTGSPRLFLTDSSNTCGILSDSNTLQFLRSCTPGTSSGTASMRIDSGGDLRHSNSGTLYNYGAATFANDNYSQTVLASYANSGSQTGDLILAQAQNTSGTQYLFFRGKQVGTTKIKIVGNGNLENANNSYGGLSDEVLKENISLSGSQWDDIKALQIKKYSFISDNLDEANQIGVIAQDLEASGMGGLVDNTSDELYTEHDELPEGVSIGDVKESGYKSVKYSVLYMKAVKALQEAITKIETLETTVADLTTRIETLENA